MVSLSMPLSDPWPGFQASCGFVSDSLAFLLPLYSTMKTKYFFRLWNIGVSANFLGFTPFHSLLPLSLPPCPLLLEVGPYLPSLSLPFPSLRSRAPKIRLGDLRARCELPEDSGAEPQPKSNLVHFSLKIWHLVATISIIFLRINWPNLVQFKHSAKTKCCFMGYLCGFVGQYRLHIKGNLLKCKWKCPRAVLS